VSDNVERRFETDICVYIYIYIYIYIYTQINMAIIIQQDATEYSLFKSVNCSTCFGWYLHPSSGAHITVYTVSGIDVTVTATCCERDWTVPVEPHSR